MDARSPDYMRGIAPEGQAEVSFGAFLGRAEVSFGVVVSGRVCGGVNYMCAGD